MLRVIRKSIITNGNVLRVIRKSIITNVDVWRVNRKSIITNANVWRGTGKSIVTNVSVWRVIRMSIVTNVKVWRVIRKSIITSANVWRVIRNSIITSSCICKAIRKSLLILVPIFMEGHQEVRYYWRMCTVRKATGVHQYRRIRFSSVRYGIYAFGKAHMRSTTSLKALPLRCLFETVSINVRLSDNGSFSSFHASLL